MNNGVEYRIVKLQNEIKALKGSQLLSGGQLAIGHYDSLWEGLIKNGDHVTLEATFQRTDEVMAPPLVEFNYELENPDDFRNGSSVQLLQAGAIKELGANSVSYQIRLNANTFYGEAIAKIKVEAVSIIPGNLSLRRVK